MGYCGNIRQMKVLARSRAARCVGRERRLDEGDQLGRGHLLRRGGAGGQDGEQDEEREEGETRQGANLRPEARQGL